MTRRRVSLAQARRWVVEACHANNVAHLAERICIEYNERFSSRMGDANWTKQRIRLSGPLFDIAPISEQEDTVKHEACHLIVAFIAQRGLPVRPRPRPKPHGAEWRAAMRRCGLSPTRTHGIDTRQVKQNRQVRFWIPCGCAHPRYRRAKATITRWSRTARRICPYCREFLQLENAFEET